MNENLVKIETIIIKGGGSNVMLLLKPNEARKVRDALTELMGPKTGDMPYFVQPPIYVDPNSESWPNKWSMSGKDLIIDL